MRDFFKSAWSDVFKGCTLLMLVKRVIASIIIAIVIIVVCGADSIGGFWVAVTIIGAMLVWKFCGLSGAFPDDDEEDTWEEIDNKKTDDNEQ